MNCVDLFTQQAKLFPNKIAIWQSPDKQLSFSELAQYAGSAQKFFQDQGLKEKDCLLLLYPLSPELYALITGALASGISVILVEPWMPLKDINHILETMKPKVFISKWWGYIWASRLKAARQIPLWATTKEVFSGKALLQAFDVEAETPGIITFTTGTTGRPKGVLRTQSYLIDQFKELNLSLGLTQNLAADLTVFANFALANLAAGKTSVLVDPSWNLKNLSALSDLPSELQPRTSTMGPGFLKAVLDIPGFLPKMESLHIGGALTDCWIFEQAFAKWPQSQFTHLYGSSEAEPVAHCDARKAVELSRQAGKFQTLFVGEKSPSIQMKLEDSSVWVSGPHVCPEYVAAPEESKLCKRRDSAGTLWHDMGDRLRENPEGLWYSGRSSQSFEDFELEQSIYSYLRSSACFIARKENNQILLVGEKLREKEKEIKTNFNITEVHEAKIFRDRRHRARLDRPSTLRKAKVRL